MLFSLLSKIHIFFLSTPTEKEVIIVMMIFLHFFSSSSSSPPLISSKFDRSLPPGSQLYSSHKEEFELFWVSRRVDGVCLPVLLLCHPLLHLSFHPSICNLLTFSSHCSVRLSTLPIFLHLISAINSLSTLSYIHVPSITL